MLLAPEMQCIKFIGDFRFPSGVWLRLMTTKNDKYVLATVIDGPGGFSYGVPVQFPLLRKDLPAGLLNPPRWWNVAKDAIVNLVREGEPFTLDTAGRAVRREVRAATPEGERTPAVKKAHIETLLDYAVGFGIVAREGDTYEPAVSW